MTVRKVQKYGGSDSSQERGRPITNRLLNSKFLTRSLGLGLTLIFCIILASQISCTTSQTKYQPYSGSGGYSDEKMDNRLRVARFAGTPFTPPEDALIFSKFRALEVCREEGFKITRIFGSDDRSAFQKQRETSNYGPASTNSYWGFGDPSARSGFYSNGWGQADINAGSGAVRDEVLEYPIFDTYFSCLNQTFLTQMRLKSVPAREIQRYSKDPMGGLRVVSFAKDSPNREEVQIGDLILQVNAHRVQNTIQFIRAIDDAEDKERIVLNAIRNGNTRKLKATAIDGTEIIEKKDRKIIATACALSEVKNRPICTDDSSSRDVSIK